VYDKKIKHLETVGGSNDEGWFVKDGCNYFDLYHSTVIHFPSKISKFSIPTLLLDHSY
jgi:hypothetical protein